MKCWRIKKARQKNAGKARKEHGPVKFVILSYSRYRKSSAQNI